MAPPSKTHQLLEINIISAQDLEMVSKSMKTYAMAWMNPRRKLTSRIDDQGKNNPTWNDKFVFRVEEDFLRQDTSAVMIEIYSNGWFKDTLVGTVRCLVGNLIPQNGCTQAGQSYIGMRFVALQIRRPSGRPQGILNIGVALLDSSMRSMPLYTQPAMSAVGYNDLMEDPDNLPEYYNGGPLLRRSRSERSEATGFDNFSPGSSMIVVKGKIEAKESSILSITECMVPIESMKKVGKASSVINGAELRNPRPSRSIRSGKASSVVSDYIITKQPLTKPQFHSPTANLVDVKELAKIYDAKDAAVASDQTKDKEPEPPTTGKNTFSGAESIVSAAKAPPPPPQEYIIGAQAIRKGNTAWSDSEVGPSPSEVAAVMAMERRYPINNDDKESSMLDGWSMDESVEGLKSKLERWRMELPPVYDRAAAGSAGGDFSSSSYDDSSSKRSGNNSNKKKDDGLFTCFGTVFGYECQCICGKPPGGPAAAKKRRSSSMSSLTSADNSSLL